MSEWLTLLTHPLVGGTIIAGTIGAIAYIGKDYFENKKAKRLLDEEAAKERIKLAADEAKEKLRIEAEERKAIRDAENTRRAEDKVLIDQLRAKVDSMLSDMTAQLKQTITQQSERIQMDRTQNDTISAATTAINANTQTNASIIALLERVSALLIRLEK